MTNAPWKDELDEEEFLYAGHRCYIRRNQNTKTLCGYVDLPPTHPWFGKHYLDDALCGVEVHGGLTYSGRTGDGLHRIGFDCCHGFDYAPGMPALSAAGAEYRDLEYVETECARLAQQAYEARGDDR